MSREHSKPESGAWRRKKTSPMVCRSYSFLGGVIIYSHRPFAQIFDPFCSFDNVVGDDGAPDRFSQVHLRLILLKLAPPHEHGPAFNLQRRALLIFPVPLHKGAITEAHGP